MEKRTQLQNQKYMKQNSICLKRKSIKCTSWIVISIGLFLIATTLSAVNKKKPLETKVKSGVYIQSDRVTVKKLRDLPIPASSEDYAFLQSFDTVTNVVIGNFSQAESIITLVTDENGDEVVDYIIHYNHDMKKFTKEANPSSIYSKEAFIQLKKNIINGSQGGGVIPNNEGAVFLKRLVSSKMDTMDLMKTRQGYTVKITDADDKSLTRLRYMFSDNGIHGVDLVFHVAYTNVYETRVQPVIQYCVYCQNSMDPTVKETVSELLALTSEVYKNR